MMANVSLPRLVLTMLLFSSASVALAAVASEDTSQLLAGDRVLLGTVEEVRSDQIECSGDG